MIFCGLEFNVPETIWQPYAATEKLAAIGQEVLTGIQRPVFCDVGTGCGNIAISLLHALPSASGYGIDVSNEALAAAAQNAQDHAVQGRLKLISGDLFENVPPGPLFDLIIGNPPYLSAERAGQLLGPRAAVTDEGDGLSIIRRLVEQAPQYLKPGGYLVVEYTEAAFSEVWKMFASDVWVDIEKLRWLNNSPLGVKARKRI